MPEISTPDAATLVRVDPSSALLVEMEALAVHLAQVALRLVGGDADSTFKITLETEQDEATYRVTISRPDCRVSTLTGAVAFRSSKWSSTALLPDWAAPTAAKKADR